MTGSANLLRTASHKSRLALPNQRDIDVKKGERMNDFEIDVNPENFPKEIVRLAPGSRIAPGVKIEYQGKVLYENKDTEDFVVV